MEAARINNVISEMTGYRQAVMNFKDKYKGYPGDFPESTLNWGTYDAGTNPNGTFLPEENDERINTEREKRMAFHHLQLANMIAGDYNSAGGDNDADPYISGENLAPSVIDGSIYALEYMSGLYDANALEEGNAVVLSRIRADRSDIDVGGTGPETAYLIDKKTDDGIPSEGAVYTIRGCADVIGCGTPSTECIDGAAAAVTSADYVLTNTSKSCRLIMWINQE